jgi:hypothetical protein
MWFRVNNFIIVRHGRLSVDLCNRFKDLFLKCSSVFLFFEIPPTFALFPIRRACRSWYRGVRPLRSNLMRSVLSNRSCNPRKITLILTPRQSYTFKQGIRHGGLPDAGVTIRKLGGRRGFSSLKTSSCTVGLLPQVVWLLDCF